MKRLLYYIIHSICCFLYRKEYLRFTSGESPKEVQERIRKDILKQNKDTVYGRKYQFHECEDITNFRQRIPLTSYEDYIPYIERMKDGEKEVLTKEELVMFELTSGSSSAKKYIPYTQSLKNEFQRGIKPWLYQLYQNVPKVKWGRSYWSITPVTTKKEYSIGGTPIGFEEDSEYFGVVENYLMKQIIITPKDIIEEEDIDKFYFKTIVALLREKHLTLISIWSPTLLLLLLEYLHTHEEEIVNQLSQRRKREIAEAIKARDYQTIWRKLAVISCWCDGNSATYAEQIRELFPKVYIQAKGLLATEGMISFPFVGEEAARISYRSHYYEFRSLEDGIFYEIDKLIPEKKYEIILTTGGGFYRYCLKDIVMVHEYRDGIPLVWFVGRQDRVTDLFGEKLNELFVIKQLKPIFDDNSFYMLAPEQDHYVLYHQSDKNIKAIKIDQLLRESFHYDYCRSLNQLKALKIFKLTGDPKEEYVKACMQQGQRLGDIKFCTLTNKSGWNTIFTGHYCED